MNTTTQRPATAKQVEFLKSLLTQIAETSDEGRAFARKSWLLLGKVQEAGKLDVEFASGSIEDHKEALAHFRQQAPKPAKTFEHSIPSGRYAVDTDEGHTGFYRVSVKDSGHTFVDVQASDATHSLPWNTAKGVLRKIEEAGVEEAATRYGVELGRCHACGRTLTDATSRELGIGPDCRRK